MAPSHSPLALRIDAESIWRRGVESVLGDRAVAQAIRWQGTHLHIGSHQWDLSDYDRCIVIGAGKATAAMADGLLQAFSLYPKALEIAGWINVPQGTFDPNVSRPIHFHAARPPGINEPTKEAMEGSQKILQWAAEAGERDFVICLLSGGGSALLPLPQIGISLDDKIAVTRLLSHRGANIEELNTVRRAISRIKDGKLAKACRAKHLVTLVLSDVLGDPLASIASGPTWIENPSSPWHAFELLKKFDPSLSSVPESVQRYLINCQAADTSKPTHPGPELVHWIVGNNQRAAEHAANEAKSLGYDVAWYPANHSEGDVKQVAEEWLQTFRAHRRKTTKGCLICGGEPTVRLPRDRLPGKGGRNQQLILEVRKRLRDDAWNELKHACVLSAGTDGEDGPTDAAGAFLDLALLQAEAESGLSPDEYADACNGYAYFERTRSLFKTGPTGTNVCDLRIILWNDAATLTTNY